MPLFDDTMPSQSIAGTRYEFSGARIEDLGATEYTLVVLVLDVSGSTAGLRRPMEDMIKAVLEACRKSPRADNLLLRLVKFDNHVEEIHGFKPLAECNPDDYDNCLGHGGGTTALYDACYTSVMSAIQYAEQLTQQDFDVNGAVYVITDGCEYPSNASTATPSMVEEALGAGVKEEKLESMVSVLIGLNSSPSLDTQLATVKDGCGFSQYVAMGEATPQKLARLGSFVSRSVSSQSQALGSGGPSQSLSF